MGRSENKWQKNVSKGADKKINAKKTCQKGQTKK
jgi:hypothetical protein